MYYRRYWFEFEFDPNDHNVPVRLRHGCGVTAEDYDEAIALMVERVFKGGPLPPITKTIEDVDIASLDGNYVLPNIGLPLIHGIWFPVGYNA
jgi:hypothetical protein